MAYSTKKTKKQDDFYKQYTLQQLIDQVALDLPVLDNYNQQQYEDWFSHVYPLENIISATDNDPYCIFILSQGKPLKNRLKQWLNLVTTE